MYWKPFRAIPLLVVAVAFAAGLACVPSLAQGAAGALGFVGADVVSAQAAGSLAGATIAYEGQGGSYPDWRTGLTTEALPYQAARTCPAATVTLDGVELAEGTDYELSYDVDHAGARGTITAGGLGPYEGQSASVSFDIIPVRLGDASIGGIEGKTYAGGPVEQDVTVSDPNTGDVFEEGVDYAVSYESNEDVGTATATITGTGLLAGTVERAFSISAAEITGVDPNVVSVTYTGQPYVPTLTVTAGSLEVPPEGYIALYDNLLNAGAANVTVIGVGNFTGTREASFTIDPLPLDDAVVEVSSAPVEYDGTAKEPFVEVACGGKALHWGLDYTTEYENNVDAGDGASVTVTGTGNYTGSRAAAFEIAQRPVAVTPSPASKAFGEEDPTFTATVSGTLGGDAVSYSVSRPGAGDDEAAGVYEGAIVASGDASQGNYRVTFGAADFTIELGGMGLSATGYDGVYDGAPHVASAVPSVAEGTTVEYSTDGGDTWSAEPPSLTGVGRLPFLARASNPDYATAEARGEVKVAPRPVTVEAAAASKAFGEADPTFTATVSGTLGGDAVAYSVSRPRAGIDEAAGVYEGAIEASGGALQGNYSVAYVPAAFTVRAASIEGAAVTVTPSSYAYDGDAKEPGVGVTLGSRALLAGVDYTVAYSDNRQVGFATVTVTGRGNYAGAASATFEIREQGPEPDPGPQPTPGPDPDPQPSPEPASYAMHRLYNKWTGEHFYTADAAERDHLVDVGWTYEDVGWNAPAKSNTPVYRLYNEYVPGGDHHYTTDASEKDRLVEVGWTYEGVGWYSDDDGAVPLYRQYNPFAETGTHNYTADKDENDELVSLGWRAEGVGWYGV